MFRRPSFRSLSSTCLSLPHTPVLLSPVLDVFSSLRPGGYFIDGTLGYGSHFSHLHRLHPSAHLLGIDKDLATLSATSSHLLSSSPDPSRLYFAHGCFSSMSSLLPSSFPAYVSGILLDLGVSSMQLDQADRGFSFLRDGPLDMRMDQSNVSQRTAADLCNSLSVSALSSLFRDFGDEPRAGLAARLVVERRRNVGDFRTTLELADCLLPLGGNGKKRRHPATRCFQALRIAVNGELDALKSVLDSCVRDDLLESGGRLAIISFHSLEDRPVKNYFRALAKDGTRWRIPKEFRKAVKASSVEVEENVRSRSARLRVIERI
eukprot:g5958.t1